MKQDIQIDNNEIIRTKDKTIQSKFDYTVELGLNATKQSMKLKRTKKDTIVHILVLVFIAIMSAVLVWDIKREASIVIDLIILIALVLLEIFNLIMPVVILNMQKKFLRQVFTVGFDYTLTEIDKNKCIESYYKDGKILMQNVCDMNTLVGFCEQNGYLFLVFNNFANGIFKIDTLENSSLEELKQKLEQTISKNKLLKVNKRR